MLSMKAKYALRALIVMAREPDKVFQNKALASEAHAPAKFLENILQELKKHKLVASKRGIFGGYLLAKPASKISVADIVRITDGPLAPVRCASLTAYERCDDCVDEKSCAIRKAMLDVRHAIASVLDHKSLLELAKK